VFDPFGDYASRGYLRNTAGEKDLEIIKIAEHELFRAQLPIALDFLAQCKRIDYPDFLEVHRILFSALYPWSGKDRNTVLPDRSVSKGAFTFVTQKILNVRLRKGFRLLKTKNKWQ
jgi:cell filamentation protein